MAAPSSRSTLRDIAYIAVFTALIIVLAFVTLPGIAGVPIVLQNAIVILAGMVLGARRGFFATALFLLLGLLGLPVLAGGRSALSAIAGPTVGYLVGYLISAAVAGFISYRASASRKGQLVTMLIIAGVVGLLIQYSCGAAGLMLRADMPLQEAIAAQLTFVPGGIIKLVIIIAAATGVHSAFPDIMAEEKRRHAPAAPTI